MESLLFLFCLIMVVYICQQSIKHDDKKKKQQSHKSDAIKDLRGK